MKNQEKKEARLLLSLCKVTEDEVRSLVKEIDTKGDGRITLNQFASFVNLDDHDPLFQSLFDRRRRNVNLLKVRSEAHSKRDAMKHVAALVVVDEG